MLKSQNIQEVMNDWESFTLQGDDLYHQNEFKLASKRFSKSVDLIEPWLEKEEKELNTVIRLFVLACHNTAHTLFQQGRKKEAEYYYSHAHFRLLSLVSRPKRSARFMGNVVFEIKTTFSQLKLFLEATNKPILVGDIQEESMRVLRQSFVDYIDDVFLV